MKDPKKNLIKLLEFDILQTKTAIISINVDLSMNQEIRKKLEGKELEECDAKIEDWKLSLKEMLKQKETLIKKLELVKEYASA
jgi:hypothetical protein